MKSCAFLGAILFGLVPMSVASAQSAASKIAPQKGWYSSLDAGLAAARKSGKPMLVIFRCDP